MLYCNSDMLNLMSKLSGDGGKELLQLAQPALIRIVVKDVELPGWVDEREELKPTHFRVKKYQGEWTQWMPISREIEFVPAAGQDMLPIQFGIN
jgi:hypothetical protein